MVNAFILFLYKIIIFKTNITNLNLLKYKQIFILVLTKHKFAYYKLQSYSEEAEKLLSGL